MGDDRFVSAALNSLDLHLGQWVFTDWNPLDLGGKPGFGGSAAATVAAYVAGLAVLKNSQSPTQIFEACAKIHRSVQGSGSGVDIAAAVFGGVLEFQNEKILAKPSIPLLAVWSGNSAKTGPRVESYLAWNHRAAFVAEMSHLVDSFFEDPVGVIDAGGALLSAMATKANILYLTPELEQIQRLAKAHGGAAKPSGAGGGDCAVAVFTTQTKQADFTNACTNSGFTVIPLHIAAGAAEVSPGYP
jgi:phosphomevalonate kinase